MENLELVEKMREIEAIRKTIEWDVYEKGSFNISKVLNIDYLSPAQRHHCETVRTIKHEMAQAVVSLIRDGDVKKDVENLILPYLIPYGADPEKGQTLPAAYLEMNAYLAFTYGKLYLCLQAAYTSKTKSEMLDKASETYRQYTDKNVEAGLVSDLALSIAQRDGVQIQSPATSKNQNK